MPVMLMPPSHQSLVAASDKHQTAPGLVCEVQSDAGVEGQVPTPKALFQGDDALSPPPVVQSFSSSPDEALAGPFCANPLDDFKEYQVLLLRVATNLGRQVEEMEEQSDTLGNVVTALPPPIHLQNLARQKNTWARSGLFAGALESDVPVTSPDPPHPFLNHLHPYHP